MSNTHIQSLKSKGIKVTGQRLTMLRTFMGLKKHVSAEEMCVLLKKKDPSIGQATVFRFMKTLASAGLAQPSGLGDRKMRYEPLKGHHDHLVCDRCGKVIEFKSEVIENEQEKLAKAHGFVLNKHRMELYGLCRACQEKGSKEPL